MLSDAVRSVDGLQKYHDHKEIVCIGQAMYR